MPDWRAYVREQLPLAGARPAHEADIVDDLASQLEEAYREALALGATAADAEAAAKAHVTDWAALARKVAKSARIGGTKADRLEHHVGEAAARGGRLARVAAGVLADARFALRLARGNPAFTAVAVLTLALGIGANTTIFSWIDAILLNPLPGADPARIVDVGLETKTSSYTAMSYPDYLDLRAAAHTLDGLIVHDAQAGALAGPGGADRIWVEMVSDNFFDVLHVTPAAGRGFEAAEGRAAIPVVMLSERIARARFGDAAHALGQTVDINGKPLTVIGVAPSAFASGYTALAMDAWIPVPLAGIVQAGANRTAVRNNYWLDSLARLAPGVTPDQASADLTAIATRIALAQGARPDGRMTLVPLWRSPRNAQSVLGPVLLVLMAMVAVVLLIACANVANLLLSRAAVRQREFALRLSLGCGRGRLIRQLLTESFLLVAVAGSAALITQFWTGGLLVSFIPPTEFPISLTTHVDAGAAAFTATIALASAVLFGLAPALQAGRTDLTSALKPGIRASGWRSRLRSTLVVAQVAFSLVLLISAGLFVRSLQHVRLIDTGFRSDHLLLASVDLFAAGYDRPRGSVALDRMLMDIRALPGVESASVARRVPLGISTSSSSSDVEPEGYVAPTDRPAWSYLNWVGPDYFRTMGIPVVAGHEYTVADRADQPEEFVVNRAFVKRYWPGQNAIGKRIRYGKDWFVVRGVVADSKYRRLNEPASPFVYFSTTWNYRPDVVFHVRTVADPVALADAVRHAIQRTDPRLAVFGVTTFDAHIEAASFQQRLAATLLSAFGALAVLLASMGLYATIAYAVSRRTREIGARLALGATRRDITRLVLSQAFRQTAAGLGIGLVLAAALAQLFASLLVGITPADPVTLGGVTLLLAFVAFAASYVPARRAARLDPLEALRYE